MNSQHHLPFGSMYVLLCLIVSLVGCATLGSKPKVKAGEEVTVHYTCRLKTDEIVATTDTKIAEDLSKQKSRIFVPWKDKETLHLVAGSGQGSSGPGLGKLTPFRTEIEAQLSMAIVGLSTGARHKVEIDSSILPGLTRSERFMTYKRSRSKPKEHRMTWEEYKRGMGEARDPEVGQVAFTVGPATGKVLSVTKDEVTIGVSVEEGGTVDMQLGTGVYHDKGDHFEIVIDSHVGDLVRTGYLVGRTVQVDDASFTVDYGHPFGGETFVCDVLVAPTSQGLVEKKQGG